MKIAFTKTKEELFQFFDSRIEGLTTSEVVKSREKNGLNMLDQQASKPFYIIFLEQFKDLLVLILLAAAVITMALGKLESSLVIFAVVLLNAVLGTVQHIKAEKSLNSLKSLSSPSAKVIRSGERITLESSEVVVGDILYLEAGDFIAADGRIIENYSLQVNESSLTGESEAVVKFNDVIDETDVAIGDRKNMVFAGSLATYGRALVLVTDIGMNTELGRIAQLLQTTKEKKTPLQVSLDKLGSRLAMVILAICAVILVINIYRGESIIDSFMFAVALAVAAIPEALSSIVTIVLALGTQKMAKENAIIRKLKAVESLGGVSVICSDKTGTLTQNKMTIAKAYYDNEFTSASEFDVRNPIAEKLLFTALLCNDAIVIDGIETGDPTETALVHFGEKLGHDEDHTRQAFPRIQELPFDSDRKLMSTLNLVDKKHIMHVKGAPDILLKRISKISTSDGIRGIESEDIRLIGLANDKFSKNGLRVLAFAYKEIEIGNEIDLSDENDLIFVGLISMIDPPREEAFVAVKNCRLAGIKPVMITGDHKSTATAIAKQLGILEDDLQAIDGHELDKLSDKALLDAINQYSVYARVSPEHKIRIVKAWQSKGKIVAMTGDGVNDAPALKQADIGVSMGITGTEVAKDAADMVLTDDNFATIVKAIENGRNIYNNIRNTITFLLSGNTAGILTVLFASLFALPVPFAPVHLLFINLLTDSLPAIALGLEPHKKHIMEENPRDNNSPMIDMALTLQIIFEGMLISASTIAAYFIGLNSGGAATASTMAFATLCFARLVHGFNCRSKKSLFKIGIFSNKLLWAAFGIGFGLLTLVLTVTPLHGIFEVVRLTKNELISVFALSILPLFVIQITRAISSKIKV